MHVRSPRLSCSGGMIFTFYKARGLKVGSSLVEEDKLELAKNLEEMAKVGVLLCVGKPDVQLQVVMRKLGGRFASRATCSTQHVRGRCCSQTACRACLAWTANAVACPVNWFAFIITG